MSDPSSVIDDLHQESEELDLLVRDLAESRWALATPAADWTVAHQIAHLAWTDRSALLAVTDAEAFAKEVEKAMASPGGFVDEGAEEGPGCRPPRCSATGGRGERRWKRPSARPPPAPVSPGTARPCRSPPWPPAA